MLRTHWLVAASLLVAGAAAAATVARVEGSESWTEVAGTVGGRQDATLTRSRFHALRGVKLWDYDRRACVLEVEQSSLNKPSRGSAGTLRACEPRLSQSWQAADVGDGRYVTAVDVCTANGPDAVGIRGLELWGTALEDGARLEKKPSAKVKVELFGCKKWHGRVACPAGQVATGIRARWNDQSTGITGLELRCHALTVEGGDDGRSASQSPVQG